MVLICLISCLCLMFVFLRDFLVVAFLCESLAWT
uniref:Uncharacterized protein n=1 Tax=Rhizophora mucronata TaxID=61149 RepID=A0A2P2MQ39_RHIMU